MNDITRKALYDICVNHENVLIIDVMNYLHRYAWVHRDLSAVIDGEPVSTGHLYGFTNLMLYLKDKMPRCAIILALDGHDDERKKLNEDYKAQRQHTMSVSSDMFDLVDMCSLVEGVYVCYHPSYEADDVIGVVSRTVSDLCIRSNTDNRVYILSNDKDMYQLVTEGTCCDINIIRKFGSGSRWLSDAEVVGVDDVKEKFNGVHPTDLVKYRAIVGDTSDNLKGYYRFRKSNAAIIAQNFDYDVETESLIPKDGVILDEKWKKFLSTVLDDMDTFRKNYAIMKLKIFDFSILPVNSKEYISPIGEITDKIQKYQLNKYLYRVGKYSPYRSMLAHYVD